MNMGLGKYDEALIWAKRSLAANPMIPYSYVGVGAAYMGLDDYEKAIEWFNKALALQPDLIDAELGLAWVYTAQGDYEQSMEHARKVLSFQPDRVDGLTVAGMTEILLPDHAEAERYFSKAMAIDSVSGSTGLGYIYWKTGRRDEAQRMFARSRMMDEKRMENGDESVWPRYDRAEVEAVLGNKEEAYKWLQKAVEAGWVNYRFIELDLCFENLRGDDRFKQIVAQMKARVDEMRKRAEEMDRE